MSSSLSLYPCLIVYGTQTGNAREIAKIIADEIEKIAPSLSEGRNNLSTNVSYFEMNEYVAKDKELADIPKNYQSILLICSTTGNGDVPDNAVRFFRQLKRFKTEKTRYSSLKYSVLGLGDTNYEKFNESGKTLDTLMKGMGAIPLLPKALADDGTGLESVVEPWKKNIIKMFKENSQNQASSTPSVSSAASESSSVPVNDSSVPSTVSSVSVPVPAAAAVSLSDRANAVIDSEKKITNPIEQPKFIARIPKCHTLVKIEENSSESFPPYILARYKNIETEAQLRGYTPEAPCLATISNARYLTSHSSHQTDGRMVIHMELELPSSNPSQRINYSPGDSIGLYVANEEKMVKDLLKRLNYTGNEVITIQAKPKKQKDAAEENEEKPNAASEPSVPLSHITSPSRLIDILLHSVDITSPPKKSFMRMLSEYCSDANDKKRFYHLLSREGFTEYDDLLFHQHATLLDLLEQFPSCNPALAHLLDQLPPLQPRYYSITTSPLVHPNSIHIAFTVVNYHTPVPNSNAAITRKGVATHHLWRLCAMAGLLESDNLPGSPSVHRLSSLTNVPGAIATQSSRFSIPIFLRRSVDFHLPEDISRPVIMIGPGTGVCPFRAFVQHRRCQLTALQSSQGRTCGWWRGLDMEIEEKEEDSFLSAPNPRLTTTIKPSNSTSNLVTLTVTRSPTPPTNAINGTDSISDDRSSIRITQIKATGEQRVCIDESDKKQINVADDESIVAEEYTPNQTNARACDSGDMVLFFGCRDRSNDFLYGNEWSSFIYDGTLSAMYAAFSRQSSQKFYVQDLINKHQKSIVDFILYKNASIYICGDGAKMAKDVQACIETIIENNAKQQLNDRGFASGAAFVDHLIKKEKRYLQDIWS